MAEKLEINGRSCALIKGGGPLFIFGADEDIWSYVDAIYEKRKAFGECKCSVAAFKVEDWNRDFSPWRADNIFQGRDFAGLGPVTLEWLRHSAAELKSMADAEKTAVCGYSMAGLFALWAFYETGIFDAAVCGSGSLWFPGWSDYMKAHKAPEGSVVYLSLGGKEEKTSDPTVRCIGEKTLEADRLLAADPGVRSHTYVLNSGGHFADSEKRMARGIVWTCEKLEKSRS